MGVLRKFVPAPVSRTYWKWRENKELRSRYGVINDKQARELQFWELEYQKEGGRLKNDYYKATMLGMAGEKDDAFLSGKIVADFGCGPRGSLEWARAARVRIGIDLLVEQYMLFGIGAHSICYVKSSEAQIPLPSGYVDFMYTLNAMDHVVNFRQMCEEIRRVIAVGGTFIGSFNLNEPATVCEPQTLNSDMVKNILLRDFDIQSFRVVAQNHSGEGSIYKYFFTEGPAVGPKAPSYLWTRAIKRV